MDVDARLEALEQENDRLRTELEALKESLGMRWLPPAELRLTGKEGAMLGRLLRGGPVSKNQFLSALYRDEGIFEKPEIKIIDVFICKLRKKLKPFEIEIHTIWGVGYQMPAPMIAKFNETWGGLKTATAA